MNKELMPLGEVRQLIKDPNYQWRHNANCLNVDVNTFVHDKDLQGKNVEKIYAKALSHCEQCSVKAECLAFAVEFKCFDGVWGNLLPDQRKGLHNHRKVRDLLKERKKK
tara:strand:- start:2 stop:328 length:327 start_codon:yes stop_codon:yes gene_type:complete